MFFKEKYGGEWGGGVQMQKNLSVARYISWNHSFKKMERTALVIIQKNSQMQCVKEPA